MTIIVYRFNREDPLVATDYFGVEHQYNAAILDKSDYLPGVWCAAQRRYDSQGREDGISIPLDGDDRPVPICANVGDCLYCASPVVMQDDAGKHCLDCGREQERFSQSWAANIEPA